MTEVGKVEISEKNADCVELSGEISTELDTVENTESEEVM